MAKKYVSPWKDAGFKKWLDTEIPAVYNGGKKVLPYKPRLVPAFTLVFAKRGVVGSYRADYNKWRRLKRSGKIVPQRMNTSEPIARLVKRK